MYDHEKKAHVSGTSRNMGGDTDKGASCQPHDNRLSQNCQAAVDAALAPMEAFYAQTTADDRWRLAYWSAVAQGEGWRVAHLLRQRLHP